MRNPVWLTALVAGLPIGATCAREQSSEEEHFVLSEQLTHDDNLFRVAEAPGPDGALAPGQSRSDYINRLTAGFGDDVRIGRQVLRAKGRVHDVRFQRNDQLDHTAGDARASWEWQVLSAWSGTIAAEYGRTLADFANSITTEKDLVETTGYSASARYELGPRWSLSAYGRHARTEHSLELRQIENFEADSGRFALDYQTPSQHAFGIEYRYIDAKFPDAVLDEAQRHSGSYEDNAALARMTYTASVHTRLRASFGYVNRSDADGTEGEYSGNTWRAAVDWTPREKFSTTLQAWHELKAYVDAESDYFVADGVSLAPTWNPRRTISLSLDLSYEEQEYIGSSLPLPDSTGRVDKVTSALSSFTWSPRPYLQFQLSYRFSDRDSNRDSRRYDAQVAGASIRWRVM
jgi:exopolysaccharide biosynthesis operon protein EpsL